MMMLALTVREEGGVGRFAVDGGDVRLFPL